MNTPQLVGESGFIEQNYCQLFIPDRLWQTNIDKDKCNSRWLSYFLITEKTRRNLKNIATGTSGTMKNISKPNFLGLIAGCPSIPEQQKIASFLSAVDQKIQQLNRKKELLETYKKGAMQQLFTQEIRFKNQNGNEFPEWEEKIFKEVAVITMGQSPDSKSYNEIGKGLPLIQGNADIKNRVTIPRQWTTQPTKKCGVGDLIMTVRAPVGFIAKSAQKACIGRGVCSIQNNLITDKEFLYQFLLNYELKWIRLEQGSTFSAVSGSDIKSISINLPSLEEQQKIAELLSGIDRKTEAVQQQIGKTQSFKKGLLQQMFV